jgi:6-phosphogluconolactonase (cycloisomerase 2 family)
MFRVDKTRGSITPVTGSPFLTPGGGYPIRSVFHKSGKFLYSAMIPSTASNVWAFSVDASSGALSPVPGSPFAGQTLVGLGGTNSIALHPSGSYLYSSGPFMGITGYSIDTTSGALSQLSGSPFVPTGTFFNTELAVHPSGNFLYMADLDADGVRVFPVASDGSVGAEIAGSPFASGAAPRDIALDPSGKFVFVPNEGDLNVTAFAINASTGALTLVGNADAGNGPSAVAVDSLGKFLYVTNYGDGMVSAYSIDSASGTLALVAGSPFAAQDGAISVVTTK